ncbi:thiopeptide-type bacteriocin biosynthesis protein [Chryseobacterium wanjuense]
MAFRKKYIKKWFFIRYNDLKSHIRVRFELTDADHYNIVLHQINQSLEKYITSGEISNLVFDTYNREIERYGEQTIEEAEFLFYKNSRLVLQEHLDFDDEEKIIVSVFYIDQILNRLGLSIDEKLSWVEYSNIGFKKEFNADKKLNSQLDKKYREFKIKYLDFLHSEDYQYFREIIINEIMDSEEILESIIEKTEKQSLQRFFESIFHMNINRIFISNQRVFEMIIYDYLFRYYKSVRFQNHHIR